ncbi:helix-turn-helix domain-containing protein [Paenibacillus sp. J2TS4]|uniref:helix-turn-helix domain-containing protein n=1 Tax=Paenibacillus sp. J2TS4 TaxID=2807194 RepID=UPI001B1C2E0B|nr:helix-turn-helix domain-containing protein [Paenibacillus sp. J2TS4]GIP32597.1 helix-turn-helix domain-containing protein [Paenibacillus sp. J2TS4]
MSRKSKLSTAEKIAAVEKYLRGEDSLKHIASQLNVNKSSLVQWLHNYQSLGPAGLLNLSKNTSYPASLKVAAVEDYLSGSGSYRDICKKYGLKSKTQLQNWVVKYNGHENLKTSGSGGVPVMTKGRSTTYDERVEIVKYCIEHQNNFAKTAQKFQVSYQQVYSWVNKYSKHGVDALQDKRGKRKSDGEMSELEKLRAQNKLLEAENRRKQMEIDFLKKLGEIERRRF